MWENQQTDCRILIPLLYQMWVLGQADFCKTVFTCTAVIKSLLEKEMMVQKTVLMFWFEEVVLPAPVRPEMNIYLSLGWTYCHHKPADFIDHAGFALRVKMEICAFIIWLPWMITVWISTTQMQKHIISTNTWEGLLTGCSVYLTVSSPCKQCQQDLLQPGQACWSWTGLRLYLHSVKMFLWWYRDEIRYQCVLKKLFTIWTKTYSDFSGLWTKASIEDLRSPSNWPTNIFLPSVCYFLIWIFFTSHVPPLKAKHCNSQQLKVNIEETFSIIYTMIQSEHMQKTFKRWMKRVEWADLSWTVSGSVKSAFHSLMKCRDS